jgi:SAM-dependent methyltransferase
VPIISTLAVARTDRSGANTGDPMGRTEQAMQVRLCGVGADDASLSSGSRWGAAFAGASVESMQVYDSIIARLFTPWAHDLIERLAPPPGCAALDIACGPGTVSRLLAERIGQGGRVVATDISPAMLEIARSKPAGPGSAPLEWIETPAAPLPLPDSAFDVVTCQQGLQFFPDKVGALAEVRRVLRPGGRAGVAVWTQVEDQLFGYLRDAIANVISVETAERYLGPFLLTGEEAAECARGAGFDNVSLERVTLPAVLHGGAQELFDTLPASGIAPTIEALEESQRAELLTETMRLTEPARDGTSLRGSLTASILTLS